MSAKDITESLGKLLLECLRTVQIPLIIYLDSICDRFCLLILAGCFLTLPDLLRLFRRDQLRDKTLFVFLFLFASENTHPLFQVKGLHHISSVIEPKDHLIAEIQALLLVSCLVIELGQLIGPALRKFLLLIFLKNTDLFIQRCILRSGDLIFQYILAVIITCHLSVLVKEFCGFTDLSHFQGNFDQTVKYVLADRRSVISKKKNFLALFIALVGRVDLAHYTKGTDVFHTTPVNAVHNLHGAFVILGLDQLIDLSQLNAKLLFIQNIHQLSIIRISLPYAYGLVKTL